MTPSFIGFMAKMVPGGRARTSLASLPPASTSPVFLLMATIEGSFTTMPLPRAYTSVLAVPRSMARSLEKILNSDRRLWARDPLEYPLFDMTKFFLRSCETLLFPEQIRINFVALIAGYLYSTGSLATFAVNQ